MNVSRYGSLPSEKIAEEKMMCRELIRELMNYNLSQRQLFFMIYLLASELENIDHMQELTAAIREMAGAELFLVDKATE